MTEWDHAFMNQTMGHGVLTNEYHKYVYTESTPNASMKAAYTAYVSGTVIDIKFAKITDKQGYSYRFGFQGQERDNEVSGNGNSYDYGFRIYNPRLGRFLSVDPLFKTFPYYTPYQFAANMPIAAIDLDGAEGEITINSPWYEGEINKAIHAGDVARAVYLAAKSLQDSRPSGDYANNAYEGASTAGSYNYNEANSKNLTVYNKKGEILFSQDYHTPEPTPEPTPEADYGDWWTPGTIIRDIQEYFEEFRVSPKSNPVEDGVAFYGPDGRSVESRTVNPESESFLKTQQVEIGTLLSALGLGGSINSGPKGELDAVLNAVSVFVAAYDKGTKLGDELGTESPWGSDDEGGNSSVSDELPIEPKTDGLDPSDTIIYRKVDSTTTYHRGGKSTSYQTKPDTVKKSSLKSK